MRLHRLITLAVILLAAGLVGCRSAAPDRSTSSNTAPTASSEVAAAHDTAGADAEVDDMVAPGASEVDDVVDPGEALAAEEPAPEVIVVEEVPEEPATEPEVLQRWALESCQAAEVMLEEGDTEGALAALDRAYDLMLQLPDDGDADYLQAKEDIRLLVADLISRHYRVGRTPESGPVASWDLELPMVDNEYVRREIEKFTTVEKKAFLEGYQRSGRYRPMILERLEEAGLPSQLSWLPMVESWFKTRAYSRASAVGMWQFISSTGLRYGLTRDSWVDERYDPVKSTDAAIGYLTDLHGMFGDWPKALAGYNCGEARVARLQRRSQTEYLDFWDLYEMLPRETRRYVPRLYAAIAIIENPAKYGMTLPEPDPPFDVATVEVDRPVKLELLDSQLGLAKGTLADLNPELRHKGTPPHAYELRVPASQQQSVVASLESLPEWKPPETDYVTHRVSRGQSLSVIARRYGTSVGAIMRANNLRSANRIREGQNLRIPVRGSVSVASVSPSAVNGVHTVSRGETLGAIARAYGTTVSRIKQDNQLSSNTIHPGQQLRVGTAQAASSTASGTYTVRRGDTPSGIAARYGIGLSALLQANNLGRRSTIYPGQTLRIP